MILQKATTDNFEMVRNFYWNLIDGTRGQTKKPYGWISLERISQQNGFIPNMVLNL